MTRRLFAALIAIAGLMAATVGPVAALTSTTTTVSLVPAATRIDEGEDVTFAVAIAPKPSTGVTITFSDDEVPAWTATATYSTSADGILIGWASPPAGPHAIRVSFPGTSSLAPSISAPAVFSVVRPTTTTVSREFLGGRTYRIHAAVSPAPPAGDPVTILDNQAPGGVLDTLAFDVDGEATADYEFSDTYHDVSAAYDGSDAAGLAASSSAATRVPASTSMVLTADGPTFVISAGAGVFAEVTGGDGTDVSNGTIEFYAVTSGGEVLLDTSDVNAHSQDDGVHYGAAGYGFGLPVGASTIVAHYLGSSNHEIATSNTVTMTGLPDTTTLVDGYSLNRSTFYPIKDGYRDTVTLEVSAGEDGLTGTTAVYDHSGSKVRTLRTGAVPPGGVQISWNGRTSRGTLLASGRYSIKTTFHDPYGNATTRTAKVALSHKKLVTSSRTYTRTGEDFTLYERDGMGWVSRAESEWTTGVLLDSGRGDSGYNQARVAYRFKVPDHDYTKVKWSVLGRNITGRGSIGLYDGTFDGYSETQVGKGYAWSSITGPASRAFHRGKAGGYVIANGYYNSIFDVRSVKIKVYWQVLR